MRNRIYAVVIALGVISLMTSVYGQRESRSAPRRQPAKATRQRPAPFRDGTVPSQGRAISYVIDLPQGFMQSGKHSSPSPHFAAAVMPAGQTAAAPWVTVWSMAPPAAQVQATYQQMATLISGYTAVPGDRTNYYSAVINDVDHWTGSLSNVQAAPGGGYTVTVMVGPIFADGSKSLSHKGVG